MGWLAVRTTADWGYTIDVTWSGAPDTYTSDPTLTDAVAAMDHLKTWLNAAGRPWHLFNYFDWHARVGDTGRGEVIVTASDIFDFEPDATAAATLGLTDEFSVNALTVSTGASGAWYPANGLHLRNWLRPLDHGNAASDGGVRGGVPGSAGLRGRCEAWAKAAEVSSLQIALRAATQPRTAVVYHDLMAAWVDVSVGALTQEAQDGTVTKISLSVAGV